MAITTIWQMDMEKRMDMFKQSSCRPTRPCSSFSNSHLSCAENPQQDRTHTWLNE